MSASTLSIAESVRQSATLINITDNRSLNKITDSLQLALKQRGFNVDLITSTETDATPRIDSDIIVSIGSESASWLSKLNTGSAILSISTTPLVDRRPQQAQLELRQPLCRQLHMISAISSDFSSVSLIEPDTDSRKSLSRCDKPDGMKVNIIERRNNEAVNNLIKRSLISDVLMATPNSDIYNRRTIKNVLLLSYRNRIPVIGFSRSFVDAGALAALHTTEETITKQAVKIIEARLNDDRFEQLNYTPESYEISINRQVSRSLGIEMPDTDKLQQLISGAER